MFWMLDFYKVYLYELNYVYMWIILKKNFNIYIFFFYNEEYDIWKCVEIRYLLNYIIWEVFVSS